MKTIALCGSAPGVLDELEEVRRNIPDVEVMAVNGAIAVVDAPSVFTIHYNFAERFRKMAGRPVEIHSRKPGPRAQRTSGAMDDYPGVEAWHDLPPTRGGSGAAAAMMLSKLGYDQIIMCGCPFNWTVGYENNCKLRKTSKAEDFSITKRHREGLAETFKAGLLENVVSMSGYSRDLLGSPSWLQT